MKVVLEVVVVLLAVIGALVLIRVVGAVVASRRRGNTTRDAIREVFGDEDDMGRPTLANADGPALAQELAAGLADSETWFMSPEMLESNPLFETGVAALADEGVDVGEVVELSGNPSAGLAAMALAALERREDVPADWAESAVRSLPRPSAWEDAFLLRAVTRHADGRVIGSILGRLEGVNPVYVVDALRRRVEGGEVVDADTFRGHVGVGQADELAALLDRHSADLGSFRRAFDEWRGLELMTEVGRIWPRPYDEPPALIVGRRRELVDVIMGALGASPRRSVLLVGEHGAGKTAIARHALEALDVPLVFDATASQILAGSVYIGQLDARVKALAEATRARSTIWVIPELQEALFAGQHNRSPHGLLDVLLPYVESGSITLVAEVTPTALEVVRSARPRVTTAFDVVHVRAPERQETLEIARHALEHGPTGVTATDETLGQAYELAQQFLPRVSPPGNLLRLLDATAQEVAERGGPALHARDVLDTLSRASGLPLAMLDATVPLRLDDVRAFFRRRILGQQDAVECVVERIAMIKAGLTDPTRPFGVFLFLGPTGTGKTEIAKTLAEFLFGSPERLVRLDMSEFQTPESLERLLADTSLDGHGAGLVSAVRNDPFSVVLLDEFEKAAAPVWDVFLQVFDDGRLTDSQGRLVDFRRCVIVLTSNVGSAIAPGPGLGFESKAQGFSESSAERALRTTFRPELLNRLDRVVAFRPFELSAMRSLLDKELQEALARRGLRERPWAVELDESAYAFLVDKGFSPELGARPLRRAIEQHVLAPLAATIVEQTAPEGDQFLFLSAPGGSRVEVTFVDPDAGDEERVAEPVAALDLRSLARTGQGDEPAVRFVLSEAARVDEAVAALGHVKDGALAALAEPTFWEAPGRFAVLAKVEYLDRLESATETAGRLTARFERSARSGGRTNATLVQLLAGRLHVLDSALAGLAAEDPFELFLEVSAGGTGDPSASFVKTIADMYLAWAERRGMHVDRLAGEPERQVLAISGLGCWRLLHGEAGIHVLEHGPEAPSPERETARVIVASREPGPVDDGVVPLELARAALRAVEPSNVVVRRYRTGPSPLVRDSVRGYRTGNLDRVLAGEFDLF